MPKEINRFRQELNCSIMDSCYKYLSFLLGSIPFSVPFSKCKQFSDLGGWITRCVSERWPSRFQLTDSDRN